MHDHLCHIVRPRSCHVGHSDGGGGGEDDVVVDDDDDNGRGAQCHLDPQLAHGALGHYYSKLLPLHVVDLDMQDGLRIVVLLLRRLYLRLHYLRR